jgi:hypothetical protein
MCGQRTGNGPLQRTHVLLSIDGEGSVFWICRNLPMKIKSEHFEITQLMVVFERGNFYASKFQVLAIARRIEWE